MAIEGRYELALGAIVFAALLDGIDGRVARLLKASSQFGAELDSLADFVNFGVAPAVPGLQLGPGGLASRLAWICRHDFRAGLRRCGSPASTSLVDEEPKWQSATTSRACRRRLRPSGAAAGLRRALGLWLPLPRAHARRWSLVYALAIAFLMVSTIPTYSGKLMGERIIARIRAAHLRLAIGFVALLLTYPFGTMAGGTLIYLARIPLSWSRYPHQLKAMPVAPVSGPNPGIDGDRVVGIRPTDKR